MHNACLAEHLPERLPYGGEVVDLTPGGSRLSDPADSPLTRDTLPIPDYDHLPEGSLTHRIHSLDSGGLGQLIDYERAHGARAPVLQVLEARRDALEPGG